LLALVIALFMGAAGAGGYWYYFRRYLPRKELEPYWNAVRAIRARNYEAALPALTGIESKLPPDLRYNARFFSALCHVHLDEEIQGEQILAALHRERSDDEAAAYLLAYVRVKRGLDAEAEPVLESLRKHGKENFRDTRRLLGVVKFRRGMEALRVGAIDLSADFFAEVEKLGDFAAFIPGDLRNRHISLGTRALFDRDLKAAREHFSAIQKAAQELPEEERKPLLAKAGLGLALAEWIEDRPGRGMDLDKLLTETCLLFQPNGVTQLPWPEPEAGSGKGSAEALKQALEAADKDFNLPSDQKDLRRCLRDIHFLRAMEVLRFWSRMDGEAANKAIPEKLAEALSRLACSRAFDERFADVYLVAGLLMFYLHEPGPERTTGVDILAEARKLGVREPEALEIINNRERVERANADAVDRYQQVLDRYLRDETVRQEVRRDLLKRLATHRSLMNRYKPPDLTRARNVPPTVDEIYLRSKALQEHILQIQRSKPNKDLEQRSADLKQQGEALTLQAKILETTESELLAITGEQLFSEG
jgi:hypothetical protein